MKGYYPVLFTFAAEVILIEVPDLKIFTSGEDILDAIDMARDAISLICVDREDDEKNVPEPTSIESIDISKAEFSQEGKTIITLVDFDTEKYREELAELNL